MQAGTDKVSDLRYSGYRRDPSPVPDLYMTQVSRGTPAGEYLRRFWHPIAYVHELLDLPLRARALGEDVVVYKDGLGQIGVLQLHCCHRNASLEFGLVKERGLMCSYHGRVFDVDGTILEMPGEPERLKKATSQGAYPTHVWGGVVFCYMGPLEELPIFPTYDFMLIPEVRIEPGIRWTVECNWLQMRENTMDPAHTFVLHAIPQLRGKKHFSLEMEVRPEFVFTETPNGFIYTAARRVGDKVWVRSAEAMGPTWRRITTIFEDAATVKSCNPPFLTMWTLPVDDTNSVTFFVSHVAPNESMAFEERRALENFGQYADRPYEERKRIPGDYDAQVGQGPISSSHEHLGSQDRGVVMFRRYVRENIQAVEAGKRPKGVYLTDPGVLPTFANDLVVDASEVDGDPADPVVLTTFAERVAKQYLISPPLSEARGVVSAAG